MNQTSLERILQGQGFGSRKACRRLIHQGLVQVDAAVVTDPSALYAAEGLAIDVEGERWVTRSKVYVALHKPSAYECSRQSSHHDSVFALLPAYSAARGVQPAGRLDQDATGLLLLSDDGPFIHQVTSPKRHVEKTYVVTCESPVTDALVATLLQGVQPRAEPTPLAALRCSIVDERRLELVIAQGKYHQVKRMMAAAENRCVSLHRPALGTLTLAGLGLEEPGSWRLLSEDEAAALR